MIIIIQGEQKRTLNIQNDRENKFCILRTSRPQRPIEKLFKFVSYVPGDVVPPLGATIFENNYPTTEELVCSALAKEQCVKAVRHGFHTHFHMERRGRVSIYAAIFTRVEADQNCLSFQRWGHRAKFGTSLFIVSTSAAFLAEHMPSLCEVCTKL